MKSNRRLKIFCFILMAFVATPQAWQQMRSLAHTAHKQAQAQWFNLLLSFQTTETDGFEPSRACPHSADAWAELAASRTPASNKTKHTATPATAGDLLAQNSSVSERPMMAEEQSLDNHVTGGAHNPVHPDMMAFAPAAEIENRAALAQTVALVNESEMQELQRALDASFKNGLPVSAAPVAPKRPVLPRISANPEAAPLPDVAEAANLARTIVMRYKAEKGVERFKVVAPKIRTLVGRNLANSFPGQHDVAVTDTPSAGL